MAAEHRVNVPSVGVSLALFTVGVLTTLLAPACARRGGAPAEEGKGLPAVALASAAFSGGAAIPAQYTCDGKNVSPPLTWGPAPPGTRSIALICEDPDAPSGTWTHWVLYDLPANVRRLPEDVPPTAALANGARQGVNDFKSIGYGGPCPPAGSPHRYFFRLYALGVVPALKAGATAEDLRRAMRGHLLATGQLMGRYARRAAE